MKRYSSQLGAIFFHREELLDLSYAAAFFDLDTVINFPPYIKFLEILSASTFDYTGNDEKRYSKFQLSIFNLL